MLTESRGKYSDLHSIFRLRALGNLRAHANTNCGGGGGGGEACWQGWRKRTKVAMLLRCIDFAYFSRGSCSKQGRLPSKLGLLC